MLDSSDASNAGSEINVRSFEVEIESIGVQVGIHSCRGRQTEKLRARVRSASLEIIKSRE